jgi:hypothetical protein
MCRVSATCGPIGLPEHDSHHVARRVTVQSDYFDVCPPGETHRMIIIFGIRNLPDRHRTELQKNVPVGVNRVVRKSIKNN